MSYKLEKPYTDEQYANFVVEYNHNQGLNIEETETALFALEENEIMVDGEPQIDADWEEKQRQQEEERVNSLTMTALDFIGVLKSFGLTSQQIREYLDEHIELNEQLTYCQNVWCGVVQQLCPLTVYDVVITKEMVIHAFKVKNGEE